LPVTIAHLHRLLAVPDELPVVLCVHKRLALAKAMHEHLGAGKAAALAHYNYNYRLGS